MRTAIAESATAASERSLAKPDRLQYELRLYVAGVTPRSARAIRNIKEVCDLKSRRI